MQTPCHSDYGTCVFHPWVPIFDVINPSRLKLPTWITIKRLPLEYLQLIHMVATKVELTTLTCGVFSTSLVDGSLPHNMSILFVNMAPKKKLLAYSNP